MAKQRWSDTDILRHIAKSEFKTTKNDILEVEPFVECTDCGRKVHQVCVLHFEQIWRE